MYTAGGGEGNNDQIPFSSAATGCCARFNSTTAEKETNVGLKALGARSKKRVRERGKKKRGETNGHGIQEESGKRWRREETKTRDNFLPSPILARR